MQTSPVPMPAVEHRLLSSMLAAPHFRNGAEVTFVVYTVPEQSGWQASEPITFRSRGDNFIY